MDVIKALARFDRDVLSQPSVSHVVAKHLTAVEDSSCTKTGKYPSK
jgi:hypothetical protein